MAMDLDMMAFSREVSGHKPQQTTKSGAYRMEIDLKLNGDNLYREESFTDMKTGAVRRLTPVKIDGSPDEGRDPIFIAQTQLMSPEGPLPVSAMLEVKTLAEALEAFPAAVKREVDRIVEMAQKAKQEDASRIIVPGQG